MDTQSTPELLPCPWPECTSQPSVVVKLTGFGNRFQGYVECHDCGARGPSTAHYQGDSAQSAQDRARAEASQLWNTRSTPDRNAVLAVAGNGQALTTSDVEEVIEGLETNAVEHFEDAIRLLRYMAGELATTPEPTDPAGVSGLADDLVRALSKLSCTNMNMSVAEWSEIAGPIQVAIERFRTPDPVLGVAKEALEHLLKVRTREGVKPQSRDAAEAKARAALQALNEGE